MKTILLSLAILAAGLFAADSVDLGEDVAFEVRLESTTRGVVQLFYDVGRGYNEPDSVALLMPAGVEKTYSFRLPRDRINSLRFDPIDREGTVTVYSARIVTASGRILRPIGLDQFRPFQQIVLPLARTKDRRSFQTTAGGNDPVTLIEGFEPLDLRLGLARRLQIGLPWILGAVLLAWLAGRAARWSGCASLVAWAQRHPRRAIFLAAAAGGAWQVHPVIFEGRSLVSPDNGSVVLLYESFPTLPSYRSPQPDNVQDSDVGALMWQHVPYTELEHAAVFGNHSLPLWDRYDLGGMPLLGQGQTMFANPLHWLSIAAGSAAWSWDLNFVLARILFAAAIGLAAYLFGTGLPAALLAAASAPFLGFFAFRCNHPASFSLCYSAWILTAWAGLVQARDRPALRRWLALLLLATWATLTSGTIKEAYMLTLVLHGIGAGVLLLSRQPAPERRTKLWWALAGLASLALVSAPLWMGFLFTLSHAYTSYDQPGASQIPLARLIGFFDDIFYRQSEPSGHNPYPSANFLVLFGLGWGLLRWRFLAQRRTWLVLAAGACIPLGLAFTLVPRFVILHLPFVARIVHDDTTFSTVLLVPALLLAATGWGQFFRDLPWPGRGGGNGWWFLAGLIGLAAADRVCYPPTHQTEFSAAYTAVVIIALALFPWLARRAARSGQTAAVAAALTACAILCLWRHGEYRRSPFSAYVIQPGQRVNLNPPSPALQFVEGQSDQPWRTIGLGQNLFPGYNQMAQVESIYGPDALRSRPYQEMAGALHLDRVINWLLPDEEASVGPLARARDFLNVRFYLSSHRSLPHPISGLQERGQFDLDVYERAQAWPRAFYTDAAVSADSADALAQLVASGDGRPFAALPSGEFRRLPRLRLIPDASSPREITPATDYRLGTNNTSFRIQTGEPGVVVLSEAYFPDDFQATVDGRPRPYFRVNHAFKGVYIDHPGRHEIRFRYRPRHFGLTLGLAAAGLGLLALGAVRLGRS